MEGLVVYGATGHSGGLVVRSACVLGLRPVLCGRNGPALERLADERGTAFRVASLADRQTMESAFRGAKVVINAAGCFDETAVPVFEACMKSGAHYLDITADARSVETLARRTSEATSRGLMVMPAVGFNVVPTDCTAVHLARRLGGIRSLAVAVTTLRYLTPGSARTLARSAASSLVRRGGVLREIPYGVLERTFDFGHGPTPALNVNLADVSTAYYSAGALDIETYSEATPLLRAILAAARAGGRLLASAPVQALLAACSDLLPPPPEPGVEAGHTMDIVVEACGTDGRRASARLRTPDAYAFTGTTAAAIARRVLEGDIEAGFQTPGRVYGGDFVVGLPGVERIALE